MNAFTVKPLKMDTLGMGYLSFVERLSLSWRFVHVSNEISFNNCYTSFNVGSKDKYSYTVLLYIHVPWSCIYNTSMTEKSALSVYSHTQMNIK